MHSRISSSSVLIQLRRHHGDRTWLSVALRPRAACPVKPAGPVEVQRAPGPVRSACLISSDADVLSAVVLEPASPLHHVLQAPVSFRPAGSCVAPSFDSFEGRPEGVVAAVRVKVPRIRCCAEGSLAEEISQGPVVGRAV
jgi:hypothetical protein